MTGPPAAPRPRDRFDRRTQGPAAMTHVVTGENPIRLALNPEYGIRGGRTSRLLAAGAGPPEDILAEVRRLDLKTPAGSFGILRVARNAC